MALKLKKSEDKPEAESGTSTAGSFPSWMKTGVNAEKALTQERAAADARDAERGKLWRYWMKAEEDATIVFLDGDLQTEGPEAGKLAVRTYREHTVKHKGDWHNIVCASELGEACPLCEADDTPALVAPFTIIDTRKIVGKKKTYENEPKLFIAKQRTITQLQKIATKRGGLTGCVFEVSRADGNSARVGSSFDFEGKLSAEELVENFGADHPTVADYTKEIPAHSAAQIRALFGGTLDEGSSVGGEGVGAGGSSDDVPF